MRLTEKQIENIIYQNPWLIDSNYVIPTIKGSEGEDGRQVNIGFRKDRYIDILFKDIRDNRPVIVELKRGKLKRIDIAQILEYKSLMISLPDRLLNQWRSEFGNNYFAPKLILIGTESDDEINLSANLTGIEIRKLKGIKETELNFASIKEIDNKLKEWNEFIISGNRILIEKAEWLEIIVKNFEETIEEIEDYDLSTINKVPSIPQSKSYFSQEFPFLNLPIKNDENDFLGFYEYYDKVTPFSNEFIYCDLNFLLNLDYEDDTIELTVNNLTAGILKKRKYDFFQTDDWTVIRIKRKILDNKKDFKKTIKKLITDCFLIFNQVNEVKGVSKEVK